MGWQIDLRLPEWAVGVSVFNGSVFKECRPFHWLFWSNMTEPKTTRSSSLRKTGERLVPEGITTAIDYLQFLRHQFPYQYVINELRTLGPIDKALEVGFGAGYGLPILAGVCESVVGIDVEEAAVAHATHKYGTDKTSYSLYDGKHIPFDDNSMDAVISFQVIEHVPHDTEFVSELHRVLKPGARLYISTPNRDTRLRPGEKPFNRYHVREYSASGLKALLQKKFESVSMMGVSGTEEIHNLEANRVRQGPLLRMVSRLGIRKLVPVSLDMMLSRALSRTRVESTEDFQDKYSLEDFRAETVLVDESLDLFGICVKQK